jgi:4-carboxymuconolactone decarboxylase
MFGENEGVARLENTRYTDGLTVRREVLGDAYVDRALASATPFSGLFQDFVSEYCWGSVWTRPGLPRQTRSLVVLGMLVALAQPAEIEIHVRGALNNGCTPEEIQEVMLQGMVYCGVPRGVEAVRIAQKVLREEGLMLADEPPADA